MKKIANALELTAELKRIAAYAATPNPSRIKLARTLRRLADAVGNVRTAGFNGKGRDFKFYADRSEFNIFDPGNGSGHFDSFIVPKATEDAAKFYVMCQENPDFLSHVSYDGVQNFLKQQGVDTKIDFDRY